MAFLWPDTTVEESNLTQTMFLLRKALDDTEEKYIRTVRGQGYTLVVPVAANDSPQTKERTIRSWHTYAAASAAIAVIGGLAVLRFRDPAPEVHVVRSIIPRPENATRFTDGLLALSPDGRRIAFAAIGENGHSLLWIRPLDTLTTQPLAETEGGRAPFWSPDSRWVAFFADGKLKKIDIQGGPPIELANVPLPGAGSWSTNGVILFSSWSVLQKVSSAGGAVMPATDASVGGLQCCPRFLPDGEHYLFSVQSRGDSQRKLLAGSLNSKASKLIGEAPALYAQWRLLYLKDNTLMAQPFDVNALRTSGGPEAVAQPVEHERGPFQVGFFTASSTGVLAYLSPPPVFGRQLTWFDHAGKVLGTVGEPSAIFDIELSPDRARLATTIAKNGNVDVWTYNLAGGTPTHFTFDPAGEFRAVWSPDGHSIVFSSNRMGNADLYRKSADGAGAEELLYPDTREKYPVSWSRDGRFILYASGAGREGDLWVLPLTPERPDAPRKAQQFLQSKGDVFGQFSTDGRWVAYESDESARPEIYVVPFARPTEKHQISPNGGARPRWRRDGKEIFYLTPDGHLMAAEVRFKADTVEVGTIRELFGGIPLGAGYFYDVSVDGQRILAVLPANRTSPVPITLVQNWAAALKK
jgi:Tol biopolymer transport system component